ncbi:MAG: winged helix-turn-helix transcriptional regulator [Candidatus Thorarchaeota archaeon]
MDEYDKRIAFELMDNSRQTLRQLEQKVGLTAPSIKKRIDQLVEAGFIKKFIVYLDDKYIKATQAIILVRTDGSVNLDMLVERILEHKIVFLISPTTSGDLFLRLIYTESNELTKLVEMLSDYSGVKNVEVHTTRIHEGGSDLSDFTVSQLRVLSQLVQDPRMPAHEIASRSGLKIRKVNQNLETLVKENMIRFGMKWNRHGRGSSLVLGVIRYDSNQTTSDYINDWLNLRYPDEYWYLRVSLDEPVVFAVFSVNNIQFLETLTKDIQNQEWTESVSVMISYSSTNLDIPHITMLIDLLTSHGLWPAPDERSRPVSIL